MIKIGVYSDKFDSVRDFYRGLGVFSRLRGIEVKKLEMQSLLSFEHFDIIFLSSPVHSTNLNIIQYAKDQNIKIWSDFDDLIPDVQSDNVAYDFGSHPNNINTMLACVRESHLVTVTTKFLKSKLLKYNKNIEVLPNAFNDFCFKLEYNLSKNNIIGWRGAIDGHGRDLMSHVEAFIELDKRMIGNGWTFNFHGKNPWYVTDYICNWTRTSELPFFQFMQSFKQLNPAIFFYPLVDCDFNRAKSELAWLDATYAGSACLMPDFETYENLPVLKYTDDLIEKTMILIEDKGARRTLYETSVATIAEKYLLSKINSHRLVLAGSLV